jgi:hypothetical protein
MASQKEEPITEEKKKYQDIEQCCAIRRHLCETLTRKASRTPTQDNNNNNNNNNNHHKPPPTRIVALLFRHG